MCFDSRLDHLPSSDCPGYLVDAVLCHNQHLQFIDGLDVEKTERNACIDRFDWPIVSFRIVIPFRFEGRLCLETVEELLGDEILQQVHELGMTGKGFRNVSLPSTVAPPSPVVSSVWSMLYAVHSLNLSDNELTCFGALSSLPNLRALCLNGNHIRSLFDEKYDAFVD
jgi:hypothetical protein